MEWIDEAYRENAPLLRGLGYRLLGDVVAAEDLLQETFVRALESPSPEDDAPVLPWLKGVATGLGITFLQRRRARGYSGPWLPMPIETGPGGLEILASRATGSTARYGFAESFSYGFLAALEGLTPEERAALVLRDVFAESEDLVSAALDSAAPAVQDLLARARQRMAAHDARCLAPDDTQRERVRLVLETFLEAVASGQRGALDGLLAHDVTAVTDAGGEFLGARVILEGREQVGEFAWELAGEKAAGMRLDIREINFLPAIVIEFEEPGQGQAPRTVQRIDLDAEGRIATWHAILASGKLNGVSFDGLRPGLGALA